MPPVEAVLIGAGQRGRDSMGAYARRHPDDLKFIAVAEVDEGKRNLFAQQHTIPPERCFASYQELLAQPQLAPLCFNGTLDAMHLPTALPAMEKGYHLFLEKPMADSPEGCLKIAREAERLGRMIQICHPLRYTYFYTEVKRLLEQRAIGDVVSLSMYENVGYWHFAHSYVRGNWSVVENTGPVILTKCCHDMDLVTWLADSKVRRVSSMGSLKFFRKENAPAGVPARCTDGCPVEATCPFSAPAFYLGKNTEWPVSVISLVTTPEARRKALETGPYGRCVFHCNNTAIDHQVVCAEFENGITLDFAVRGTTFHCGRTIRVLGTEGEINGHLEKPEIRVIRYGQGTGEDQKPEIIVPGVLDGGHSGGDTGVIANFLRCYRENDYDSIRRSLAIAVEGHLLAFAAEAARKKSAVLSMEEYRECVQAR
jgi:predicted dehydrogenase